MTRITLFSATLVTLLAATSLVVRADDVATKCQSTKLKEAGRYGSCRLRLEGKTAQQITDVTGQILYEYSTLRPGDGPSSRKCSPARSLPRSRSDRRTGSNGIHSVPMPTATGVVSATSRPANSRPVRRQRPA